MADLEQDQGLASEHEALLQFLYLCPHGVAQFDRAGTISLLNPAFACLAMPLLRPGEAFSNLLDLLEPCLPDLRSLLRTRTARGMICDGVRIHLGPAAPGQTPRVLSLTVMRIDPDRHMLVLSDLTQQVAHERRLRESEAWFTAFVQGADDYAILGVDDAGAVSSWNASGERLFGLAAQDVIGRSASGLVTAGKPDPSAFADRLQAADRDGWHLDEGWRRRANGLRFWGTCMVSPIDVTAMGPSPSQYLMVVRDVTKQRSAATELRRALTVDHLTGVLNRRCFLERAEQELARKARGGGGHYIAMVDADHFKSVNDKYGHATGDSALQAIAEVLQAECRDGDLVGRLGGEEFAMMMLATTSEIAGQIAERLRAGVAALLLQHGQCTIRLTISIGLAGGSQTDLKQLLIDADAALYEAKRTGRDRVCGRHGRQPPVASPGQGAAVLAMPE